MGESNLVVKVALGNSSFLVTKILEFQCCNAGQSSYISPVGFLRTKFQVGALQTLLRELPSLATICELPYFKCTAFLHLLP